MDEQLRFKCFVLTQNLDHLEGVLPDFLDDFDTYLVSLDFLEERTGLTFASLRDNISQAELQRQTVPVLVTDVELVDW